MPLKIAFDVPISGDVTLAFSGAAGQIRERVLRRQRSPRRHQARRRPLYFNNPTQHLTLPTHFFPATLGYGQHTILLKALTDETNTDKDDFYSWIVD